MMMLAVMRNNGSGLKYNHGGENYNGQISSFHDNGMLIIKYRMMVVESIKKMGA
jgi:hypothetical protein